MVRDSMWNAGQEWSGFIELTWIMSFDVDNAINQTVWDWKILEEVRDDQNIKE